MTCVLSLLSLKLIQIIFNESVPTSQKTHALLDRLKQQLVSKRWGKLSKGISFLLDNASLQKAAITHQRQSFILKLWNIRPTHLIWPLRTTTSFLTSRNTSKEERFRALRRPHQMRTRIFLGCVKEVRTTNSGSTSTHSYTAAVAE
jgi:hypothetical protein